MIKADMKNIDFLFSVFVYKGNKDKDLVVVDMKDLSFLKFFQLQAPKPQDCITL